MSATPQSAGQRRIQLSRKTRTRNPGGLDLRTPSGRVLPW